MAEQLGNIKITGTFDNLCFYRMEEAYYVRRKSSLTAKRVKTSPRFAFTRVYAGLAGQSSKMAAEIYRALPPGFRQYWMFRAFTGEAFQSLKRGKTPEEAREMLWQTYVSVWELKKTVTQAKLPLQPRRVKTSDQHFSDTRIIMEPVPVRIYATRRKRRKTGKRKRVLRRKDMKQLQPVAVVRADLSL